MKGQYFLPMTLLALLLVSLILVYYSSTNQAVTYETYSYNPGLASYLEKARTTIMKSLVDSIYNGDSNEINTTIDAIKENAGRMGNTFNASCTNGENNNTFWVNCTLSLESKDTNLTSRFNYTYTVPFNIRTFSDENYSNETDYFYRGNTVFIWVSGNNSDHINVSIFDPYSRLVKNWTSQLTNWHWEGNFKPSISGNWTIKVEDINTSQTVEKKIYVNIVNLDVKTYNSEGIPQTDFYPGDTIQIKVDLSDIWDNKLNCSVKLSFIDSIGKMAYNIQGETVNGVFTKNLTLDPYEIPGNMTITATEHCHYSQKTISITILGENWTKYIEIVPPRMYYNRNYSNVFGANCGYTDWYTSNQTNYSVVPFYVENKSENKTLLVNQSTLVIDVPNFHITKVHFLGSKEG